MWDIVTPSASAPSPGGSGFLPLMRGKGSCGRIILRTERMWRKVSGLFALLLREERGWV